MKQASHRNFGKQIIVAAVAVVSLVTIEVRAQADKQTKSTPPSALDIRTSHDTPPPVTIMDGSFIVEIDKPIFDEEEGNPGQSKKYRIRPSVSGRKLYLSHIKVVDGSGELLFRGDYHDSSSDLNIVVSTPEGDLVNFGSVGNKFQIEASNGRKLVKTAGLDQPVGSKRRARFRLKNDAETSETRLRRITVKKGAVPVFDVDLRDLPPMGADGGKETKVLIWLAETP